MLALLAGCGAFVGSGPSEPTTDDDPDTPLVESVPAGVDVVVGVDLAAVRDGDAAVPDRYLATARARPGPSPLDGVLGEVDPLAGTDLAADADRVVAFGDRSGGSIGVLVRANWTGTAVADAYRSLGRPVTNDSGVYAVGGDATTYFARSDTGTWVLSRNRTVVADALAVAAGNATPLSGDLAVAYDRTRTDAVVRYAARVTDRDRDALAFADARFARVETTATTGVDDATHVAGSLAPADDGVTLTTVVRASRAPAARRIASRARTGATPLAAVLAGATPDAETTVSRAGDVVTVEHALSTGAAARLVETRLDRGVVAVAPLPATDTLLGARLDGTPVDAVPATVSGVATVDAAVLDDATTRRLLDATVGTGPGDLRDRLGAAGIDLDPDGLRRVTLFARAPAEVTVGNATTDRADAGALVAADWRHDEVVAALRATARVETDRLRGHTVYAVRDEALARPAYLAEFGRGRWVVTTNRSVVAGVLGVAAGTRPALDGPVRRTYDRTDEGALVRAAVRVPASVREVIRTRYGDRAGRLDAFALVERVGLSYDTPGEDLHLRTALVAGDETDATRVGSTVRTYAALARRFAADEVEPLVEGLSVEDDGATVTVGYRVAADLLVAALDGD